MYRLLIVDDEPMILDWLHWIFSELNEPKLDIYKANTAMEAIEWMNKYQMHIVLTDIHMPGMNGLQLMSHIHEYWPDCKIIFLTGYDEFDYVYKVIQYEGVSYLLKTEDDSEIIKAVEKAITEIEQSYNNEALLEKAKQQMEIALPLLQREFLADLFNKGSVQQKQLDELQIPLNCNEDVLLLLGSTVSPRLSLVEKSQAFYTVKLMVEKYLFVHATAVYILCEDAYLTWIIQPNSSSWERPMRYVRENLETVQKMCMESLSLPISFSIASDAVAWEQIPAKYQKLKQLLHSSLSAESSIVITEKEAKEPQKEPDNLWMHKTTALSSYLERGQKEEFYVLLSEMTKYLASIRSMHHIPALSLYFSMSLMFLSYIDRWNIVEKLAFKTGTYKLTNVEAFESWTDAVSYLHQLSDIIFDLREDERGRQDRYLVRRIQDYINAHLSEDISLVRLADLAGFNPSYLSRLFKQMTGTNISDYIFQTRLEKAKNLLAQTNLKIHEIAAMIGYDSPAYFSKFFKKATSMTPQGYRDSLHIP